MTSLLSTSVSNASDTIPFEVGPSNTEVLDACDAALDAKIKEASLCDLGVKLRTDEITRLSVENTKLQDKAGAWHRNPAIWAAIGVIFGVYAGARAVR